MKWFGLEGTFEGHLVQPPNKSLPSQSKNVTCFLILVVSFLGLSRDKLQNICGRTHVVLSDTKRIPVLINTFLDQSF